MKGRVWSVAELIHSAPDQSGWPSAYLPLNLNLARRLFLGLSIIQLELTAPKNAFIGAGLNIGLWHNLLTRHHLRTKRARREY